MHLLYAVCSGTCTLYTLYILAFKNSISIVWLLILAIVGLTQQLLVFGTLFYEHPYWTSSSIPFIFLLTNVLIVSRFGLGLCDMTIYIVWRYKNVNRFILCSIVYIVLSQITVFMVISLLPYIRPGSTASPAALAPWSALCTAHFSALIICVNQRHIGKRSALPRREYYMIGSVTCVLPHIWVTNLQVIKTKLCVYLRCSDVPLVETNDKRCTAHTLEHPCPPPENDKRMNLQKMYYILIYIVIGITNDLYRDMIFWSYRTALLWIKVSSKCQNVNVAYLFSFLLTSQSNYSGSHLSQRRPQSQPPPGQPSPCCPGQRARWTPSRPADRCTVNQKVMQRMIWSWVSS